MITKIYFNRFNKCNISRDKKYIPNKKVEQSFKGILAESLLIGDKIFIPVIGPNLEICTMLRLLGKKDLEKLFEQDIIKFIYLPGIVTYLTIGNLRFFKGIDKPGLNYIVGAASEWMNPFDSAMILLKEQTNQKIKYLRHLSRLVEKNSSIYKAEIFINSAIEISKSDIRNYYNDLLNENNIRNPDLGIIPENLKRKYIDLTNTNLNVLLAADNYCNEIYSDGFYEQILNYRFDNLLHKYNKSIESYKKIEYLEDLPNCSELLNSGILTFKRILELRNSSGAKEFRNWLSEIQIEDPVLFSKEYIKQINRILPSNSKKKRNIKIILFTGINVALNLLNPVISTAASIGINFVDTLIEDSLKSKWKPKIFIEKFKSYKKNKK